MGASDVFVSPGFNPKHISNTRSAVLERENK
jgi:hypothetical protein